MSEDLSLDAYAVLGVSVLATDDEIHRAYRAIARRMHPDTNPDPDYLDASLELIGVPVDERVTASEIGSYKPAVAHWETFFRRTGADRRGHVHVAASLFHDVQPCAGLGLPCVWINRIGETSGLPRSGELPTLDGLPDLLDGMVPA